MDNATEYRSFRDGETELVLETVNGVVNSIELRHDDGGQERFTIDDEGACTDETAKLAQDIVSTVTWFSRPDRRLFAFLLSRKRHKNLEDVLSLAGEIEYEEWSEWDDREDLGKEIFERQYGWTEAYDSLLDDLNSSVDWKHYAIEHVEDVFDDWCDDEEGGVYVLEKQ